MGCGGSILSQGILLACKLFCICTRLEGSKKENIAIFAMCLDHVVLLFTDGFHFLSFFYIAFHARFLRDVVRRRFFPPAGEAVTVLWSAAGKPFGVQTVILPPRARNSSTVSRTITVFFIVVFFTPGKILDPRNFSSRQTV